MIDLNKEIVIISGVRPDSDRTFELATTLRDNNIDFCKVDGVYLGDSEVSFACKVEGNLEVFKSLCVEFDQECILYKSSNNNATLIDQAGDATSIGKFTEVDSSAAKSEDNYTFCPSTRKYFICK